CALAAAVAATAVTAVLHLTPLPVAVAPFLAVVLATLAARRPPRLSLPFQGEWYVCQGEDGGWTHYGPWRHAWDFIVLDREGRSHRGEGVRLDDYLCFDRPVLAPADGVVEAVVDDVPDNPPGQPCTQRNWGNHVILRHGRYYTELSHFRQGSILVRPGQRVRRGEVLGRCGNSGLSCEPHLHLQLQESPEVGAATIPAEFVPFEGAGPVPVQGTLVRPRSQNNRRYIMKRILIVVLLVAAVAAMAPAATALKLEVTAVDVLNIQGSAPQGGCFLGISLYPPGKTEGKHAVRKVDGGTFSSRQTIGSQFRGGTYEVALWQKRVPRNACTVQNCAWCRRNGFHMDGLLLYRTGQIGGR
ncbi:MAG: M23 family metallopeptidase, partial [Candidatus Eremiobacterota bacterium]